MSPLYAVAAMALFAGVMTLLFHPLLRFLRVPEVPAALLACATGRRHRLAFILCSRRSSYLEDIACLPPGPLVTVPREKTLATELRRHPVASALLTANEARECLGSPRFPVASAGDVAGALEVHPGPVSVHGIGPRPVVSFDDILRGL